nr:unnamed protein product [Callosobruchus chinensis]
MKSANVNTVMQHSNVKYLLMTISLESIHRVLINYMNVLIAMRYSRAKTL